jgi:hypothetical protein
MPSPATKLLQAWKRLTTVEKFDRCMLVVCWCVLLVLGANWQYVPMIEFHGQYFDKAMSPVDPQRVGFYRMLLPAFWLTALLYGASRVAVHFERRGKDKAVSGSDTEADA